MASRKLKLDVETLAVETFAAAEKPPVEGTVYGHFLTRYPNFPCGDSYNDPCMPSHVPTNCEGDTSYEATCRDSITAC